MQIQGIIPPNQPAQPSVQPSKTGAYKVGDTINAKVVDVSGGSVTLKLSDGSVLNASREGASTMRAGDTVQLLVSNGAGAKPELSLVSINDQPLDAGVTRLDYMLMQMNVTPSMENAANARTLQSMALPVAANTLSRMAMLSAAFPELPSEHAAVFASSDLPVNENNVAAFRAWLDSPVNVSALAQSVAELANADPEFAAALRFALTQTADTAQQAGAQTQGAAQNTNAAQTQAAGTPVSGDAAQTVLQLTADVTPVLVSADAAAQTQTGAAQTQAAASQSAVMQEMPQSGAAQIADAAIQAGSAEAQSKSEVIKPASTAGDAIDAFVGKAGEIVLHADGTIARAASSSAQSAAPLESAVSEPLAKIFDGLFKAIDANAVQERGEAVKDAVVKLPESVMKLTNALTAAAARTSEAQLPAQASNALFTQLQMGAEMGTLLYAQIPLRSGDSMRSADLYVMKRDRGASEVDPANATIAICLDTENMGLVESLLHVEKNELSVRFRVGTERVRDFLRSRLSKLYAMEFPAQYRFNAATVALTDSPISPANAAKELTREFIRKDYAAKGIDITV